MSPLGVVAVLGLASSLVTDAQARSRRSHGPSSGYAYTYAPSSVRAVPVTRAAPPTRRGPSPLWLVPMMGGGGGGRYCWLWDERQPAFVTCY